MIPGLRKTSHKWQILFWLGRMSRCDASETQEKQQPWEVKQGEMGWFGARRVYGGVGYRWPFRRVGGAGVDGQRFLGKTG